MSQEKKSTDWMQQLWRPMMGWMYMLICLLDMAVFPVLWSALQAYMKMPITQWNPLTLQGAGLFHIAMGAVLGIAAFGRTQEKLAGTAANPNSNVTSGGGNGGFGNSGGFGATGGQAGFGAPSSGFGGAPAGGFGAPASGGFGSPAPSGFGAPAASAASSGTNFGGGFGGASTPVGTTASGKKIVPEADQPLL